MNQKEQHNMAQETFLYSSVSRGTAVLAEHVELSGDGNLPAIAAQCLQRLPLTNNKFTYNYHRHSFNFLVEDGYVYCIVSRKESVGNQIAMACLERIKGEFNKRYGGGKADSAIAKSLTAEFSPVMKEQMQYTLDHGHEIEKLARVQAQVSEVKSIMLHNIDKTIERGANLSSLNDKADDLRNSAEEFNVRGGQLKGKMWRQNMKVKLVVFGIIFLLVLIIWLSICRGFNCSN
ncbi:vesicle-associated membrane protein 724-like [Andrographis paniculata]|uniref:vesicle-associated membrane protein 724-like n=1 Tax=Andrographis paniculata TaxID=175694 RepID=UPI0021E790A9|nr:vesicle-associated membrane protein 724-like [Andrographis paniculata]